MLYREPAPYEGAALGVQRDVLVADENRHAILKASPRQLDLVLRVDQVARFRERVRPLGHREDGRVSVGENRAPFFSKTRQPKGVDDPSDLRDCYAAQLDLLCNSAEGLGAWLQIAIHPGLGERALQSEPASVCWVYGPTIGGE